MESADPQNCSEWRGRLRERLEYLAAVRKVPGSNPTLTKTENTHCSPKIDYCSGRFKVGKGENWVPTYICPYDMMEL